MDLQWPEGWAVAAESTLKVALSHDSLTLVLAVGGKSQFPCMLVSLQSCLDGLMAWWLFPLLRAMGEEHSGRERYRGGWGRGRERHRVYHFYDLVSSFG